MKTKPRATPRRAKATVSKHVPLAPPSEYPSMVGRVLINDQRRVGLVTADCAAWTRMLRIGDGGVDIVRMLPDTLASEGWKPLECERAAFKLANTLARSPMAKSPNAVRAIEAAQAVDFKALTIDDMAAEFNRLSGAAPRLFKRRVDVERALRKAMEICNATQLTNEGDTMAATKKAAKGKPSKSKAKPVKKAAAPKAAPKAKKSKTAAAPRGGIGAMARDLITKHPDMENAEIVDQIKIKFPDTKTNAACISWYRGAMKRGK